MRRTPGTRASATPRSSGSSDSVRNPCATVRFHGDSRAARSGSVWIHWKSPVAAAKASMRAWSTSTQSLTWTSCPTCADSCDFS